MEDNFQYINRYFKETNEIIRDIDKNQIDKFINILYETWKNKKKVIAIGNGGSAGTASHFAADLAKTVSNDSSMKEINPIGGFKALCLTDNPSLLTAWVNDNGWDNAYTGMLNTFMEEGDTILLISVHGGSGWSGNIVKAMDFAKKKKGKLVGLAGFDGGKMKEMCDACIVVPKDSTPHTEGFHGVLQHLTIFRLKELIDNHVKKGNMPKQSNNQQNSDLIKDLQAVLAKHSGGLK